MGRFSPAETLENIEKEYQIVRNKIGLLEWIPRFEDTTMELVAELRRWKIAFGVYQQAADELLSQGFPRIQQRLLEIQSELDQHIRRLQAELAGSNVAPGGASQSTPPFDDEVRQVFKEMAETHNQHEQRRARLKHDTEREIAADLQAFSQRSSEEALKRLSGDRKGMGSPGIPSPNNSPTANHWPTPGPAEESFYVPPVSNSRHSAFCKFPECGKQCVQPASHGGPCRCENNHAGYF